MQVSRGVIKALLTSPQCRCRVCAVILTHTCNLDIGAVEAPASRAAFSAAEELVSLYDQQMTDFTDYATQQTVLFAANISTAHNGLERRVLTEYVQHRSISDVDP